MIKATRKPWLLRLFRFYVQQFLFKRSFSKVLIQVDEPFEQNRPLLFIGNHSSWWDGMVALLLTKHQLKQPLFMMMSEEGLKKYAFFRHFGAFSINRDKPKEMIQSLRYAQEILTNNNSVWVFPQGEEQALEKRPLGFLKGIGWLSDKAPQHTDVVPITISYAFADKRKPYLLIHIGKGQATNALNGAIEEKTAFLEQLLTAQLDQQKQAIIKRDYTSYTVLTL
ncbi:lysophospholipid acyltransferase family protein [Shouchella sp. 1P09AA]|uniref:lysophospholipid acyltransferase family protein n=1 Tax=unclassified Shouchella TaxID=2893065 RepID=UPI0039A20404